MSSRRRERSRPPPERPRQRQRLRSPTLSPQLPPPPPPQRRFPLVDREKTCPFLVRVFVKYGRNHHSREEFEGRDRVPGKEIQIYTWKDATLRELTELTLSAIEPARRSGRLSFALVFPDRNGIFIVRPVGRTLSHGVGRLDDHKMLGELGFEIGDYLDVAIEN